MTDYHSDFEYISRSMLVDFVDRREKYAAWYVHGEPRPFYESDPMRIGSGTHAISLRDVTGIAKCLEIPADTLDKNGHRTGNNFKRFALKHRGKTLLTPKQWKLCHAISEALHERLGGLINHEVAVREQEHRWTDVETGLKFRSKPDIEIPDWDDGVTLCIDLKVSGSTEPGAFRAEVRRRKLWLQHCHYEAGLEEKYDAPVRFLFACVERHGDHNVAIMELDDETLLVCRRSYAKVKADLAACYESGEWADPRRDLINKVRLSERDVY